MTDAEANLQTTRADTRLEESAPLAEDASLTENVTPAEDDGRASLWLPPLCLQRAIEPRADGRYSFAELSAFHDLAFVESAYTAVLRRAPTRAELSATLADLRALRREKIEIIRGLINSADGADAKARISGVGTTDWKQRARRLPFVGSLWELLSSLARLPRILRDRREFESYALAQQQVIIDLVNSQQQVIADHVNTQQQIIVNRITAQQQFVADHIAAQQQAIVNQVEAARRADDERADAQQRAFDAQMSIFAAQLGALDEAQTESRQLIGDAIKAISILSDALAALATRQSNDEQHLNAHQHRLDAQQEYLAREQHAIIEAQRAVLAEIEARLFDALAAHADAYSHKAESA